MVAEHLPDSSTMSTIEIAHINSISQESVSKIEKQALARIRSSEIFQEMEDLYDGELIRDIDGMDEFTE
jgi:DNA-directed RNA polymerase sigma subunit (sigma70/sigma32)